MRKENNAFGSLLKSLIKDAGLTHYEFYSKLGIKKPYFYDILSGRVNPPPPDLQFRAMEILNTTKEVQEQFFDIAARARGEVPADIKQAITDNPNAVNQIRKAIGLHVSAEDKSSESESR